MSIRPFLAIAAVAILAIAAWPFLRPGRAQASHVYVAPVQADYVLRDKTVAFYESRVRRDPEDQISAAILGGQYMQRYREDQDVGDILRALHQGLRSEHLQSESNIAADAVIASAYYALHKFRAAYRYEAASHTANPYDANAPSQMALLDMEMGKYPKAQHELRIAAHLRSDASIWAAQSRYAELTGNLAEARRLMTRASQWSDQIADNPAESRAWYHFRLGEMAFSAGDAGEALAQEHTAIADFPNFEMAYRALARFCWAGKDWHCALDAAQKGAAIIPEPETLGYEADAQLALGDTSGAHQTQELIYAVERIGNAYNINDRLLSVYYAEHGVRLNDALQIARREVLKRGTEIYAQDTLAWAAAMDGHWNEAYRAERLATRYHTQDPRILFHAGMIELHFGHANRARDFLTQALSLNPHLDPFYADRAREALAKLSASAGTSTGG